MKKILFILIVCILLFIACTAEPLVDTAEVEDLDTSLDDLDTLDSLDNDLDLKDLDALDDDLESVESADLG